MKKTPYILIIAGILIFLYPLCDQLYSWYWQEKLLSEWEQEYIDEDDAALIKESYEDLDQILTNEVERINLDADAYDPDNAEEKTYIEEASIQSSTEVVSPKKSTQKTKNTLGTVQIDKINLRMPIVPGANQQSLKKAAGHITGTAQPGEIGNSAIAAHRAYAYGRFFNRLDELEIGDEITVSTNNGVFNYTVFKKKVVEPTDLSVLNRNSTDRVLTLITCDPIFEGTHRLIIHAKMS